MAAAQASLQQRYSTLLHTLASKRAALAHSSSGRPLSHHQHYAGQALRRKGDLQPLGCHSEMCDAAATLKKVKHVAVQVGRRGGRRRQRGCAARCGPGQTWAAAVEREQRRQARRQSACSCRRRASPARSPLPWAANTTASTRPSARATPLPQRCPVAWARSSECCSGRWRRVGVEQRPPAPSAVPVQRGLRAATLPNTQPRPARRLGHSHARRQLPHQEAPPGHAGIRRRQEQARSRAALALVSPEAERCSRLCRIKKHRCYF